MAAPTLQDVCKLAGTSDATASMILNGGQAHKFRPETREQVERAARQLGYVPQYAAQMLRTGRSYNIAMLLNDLRNPFFAGYTSMLQRELITHGYTAIPLETGAFPERESELLNWLTQRNVDGVIDLQGMPSTDAGAFEKFASKAPLIIRSVELLPAAVNTQVVRVDYQHGMQLLARHFASIDCKNVGVLTVSSHMPDAAIGGGDSNWTVTCDKAFADAGIPINKAHWFDAGPEDQMQGWYEAAKALAKPKLPIDGLVVHNAALMPAALQGLAESDVQVGRDLAVATFDDPAPLTYLAGGVTTVREPVDQIAALLVEGLIKRLDEPDQAGTSQTIQTELVVRGSTDPQSAGIRP
jgi:LacI family transcriptional regulator